MACGTLLDHGMGSYSAISLAILLAAVRVMNVDERSNGRVIETKVRTTIVVQLDAQFGTGYSWAVESSGATLKLIDSTVARVKEAGSAAVGARERQVFRFRVMKKGRAAIRLVYKRPWEKESPPAKTFSLTVDSR